MGSWAIIAIVAIGCGCIITIVKTALDHEMEEKKMNAALRQQEMEYGVAPGTYTGKRARKQAKVAFKEEVRREKYRKHHRMAEPAYEEFNVEDERTKLRNGIDNLQQRIDNIETIMRSRTDNDKN